VLRASEELDEDNLALFDSLLYVIYSDRSLYKRFHPRIYKKFGISLNEKKWFNILNRLSDLGCLSVNFELCCPDSDETIRTFDRYDMIPFGMIIDCPNCGNIFPIDEKDIFITYTFNDIFKPIPGAGRDPHFFLKGIQCSKKNTPYPF
jgi:hypothetical protein